MVKVVIKSIGTLNVKHDDSKFIMECIQADLGVRDISSEIGKRGAKKRVKPVLDEGSEAVPAE